MFDVFYQSPKGSWLGKYIQDESALIKFVSKLRKPARIMAHGVHVGRVWKDNDGWKWFYDPQLIPSR